MLGCEGVTYRGLVDCRASSTSCSGDKLGFANGEDPDEDSLRLNCEGELERKRGEVEGLVARRPGVVVAAGTEAGEELDAEFGANDEKAKLSLLADPSALVEEGVVPPG